MTKFEPGADDSVPDRAEPKPVTAAAAAPNAERARKPYRSPVVEKRRSLRDATLISGSGVPALLVGGGG
jgi:hypothetical protein